MFFQVLSIYIFTIFCSALAGVALSWRGIHIVARKNSLQVLCVAQGAISGGLLALILKSIYSLNGDIELFFLGVICSFIGGLGVGIFVEKTCKNDVAEKPNILLSYFVLLLAINALLSAIFPQIETHMSQMFFGDLATVSDSMAIFGAFHLFVMDILWIY